MGAGVLLGREAELATLDGLWGAAAPGDCAAAVVVAPAGFGKTTVLRDLAARAGPATVLWAGPEEDEHALPFGVLAQLLRDRAASGSAVLPAALAGDEADPLVVGSAFLALLEEAADLPGVLVIVDDVQWADLPSIRALVFALRRLRGERAMAVLACRSGHETRVPVELRRLLDDRATWLTLGGLEPADVAALAVHLGQPGLSDAAISRVTDHTGGSPLLVRAVLAELSVAQLEGDRHQPLPAPGDLTELVAARMRAGTEPGRALVEAAAVAGDGLPLATLAAVAGVTAEDATAGVTAGLLRSPLTASAVELDHPLVRSAVYHGTPRARRAELHRRLAEQLAVTDVAASLRHRVAATDGPDPDLAGVLAERAAHDAAAGSWAAAAHGFQTAADLREPGTPAWSDHVVGLVDCVVLAGDRATADEVVARLERFAPGPLRDYGLGRLHTSLGELGPAKEHFDAAWAAVARSPGTDRWLADRIADEQARLALNGGDAEGSVLWSDRVGNRDGAGAIPGDGPLVRMVALLTLGRSTEAEAAFDLPPEAFDSGPAAVGLQAGRGMLRTWTGRLTDATADLDAVLAVTSRRGPAALHVFVATAAAEAAYRVGDWDRSVSIAEAAATLAGDVGQVRALPLLHAVASQALAGRGEWATASHHVALAAAAAEAVGEVTSQLWAALAAARLADARGDPSGVIGALAPFRSLEHLAVTRQPAILAWRGLLTAALVATDQLDAAEEVLRRAIPETDGCPDPVPALELTWVSAGLAAARGHPTAGEERIEAAAAQRATITDRPFDTARFDLAAGSLLRRSGRRKAAAAALQQARDGLFGLKATPWVALADEQLARSGLRPRLRHAPVTHQLTPNEAAVARLATAGWSNREIAAELIVSVKTVEYHLSNVYRKLGVRSRGRLAALMGGDT